MKDLTNVYTFSPDVHALARTGADYNQYLLEGKQVAFTTREKAVVFRRTHKVELQGHRMSKVTLCQSNVCIPAIVDPK